MFNLFVGTNEFAVVDLIVSNSAVGTAELSVDISSVVFSIKLPAAVYIGQRCKGKGKDFFGKEKEKVGNYFSILRIFRNEQYSSRERFNTS